MKLASTLGVQPINNMSCPRFLDITIRLRTKRKQEGNSLSDLRRMDMLNDTDNYIIKGTYVSESYES